MAQFPPDTYDTLPRPAGSRLGAVCCANCGLWRRGVCVHRPESGAIASAPKGVGATPTYTGGRAAGAAQSGPSSTTCASRPDSVSGDPVRNLSLRSPLPRLSLRPAERTRIRREATAATAVVAYEVKAAGRRRQKRRASERGLRRWRSGEMTMKKLFIFPYASAEEDRGEDKFSVRFFVSDGYLAIGGPL